LLRDEEILDRIFAQFDSRYDKTKDAARIARAMTKVDIAQEMRGIIQNAVSMAQTGVISPYVQ
jgi:hypothetical protein